MKLFFRTFSLFLLFNIQGCLSVTKNSLSVKTPENWSKLTVMDFQTLVAPEKDMKIYFHKERLPKDFNFSKKSINLWKIINPDFSYREFRTITPPVKNWDKITQIIYQVPFEESKIILTLLRIKNGFGYFNLIESGLSTFDKRSAQMTQILESWKPETIKAEDFSKVIMKDFKFVERDFEIFLLKTLKDMKVPGTAIGIIQNGQIVYQKGFGQTKIKNGKPVNSDTLFMIGSITKPLTTLLMSKLVYEGQSV